MSSIRRHLSYANVTATLALVFAMGGGAMAASHYSISSTKQISPKVIKALKGKTGKTGPTGAAGAQGKEGAPGKEGKEGQKGPAGATNVTVARTSVSVPSKTVGLAVAVCPAGTKATGGGVNPAGVTEEASLIKSFPSEGGILQSAEGETPTSWGGEAYNPSGSTATLYVFAICASP